jgi:hypothetical protein
MMPETLSYICIYIYIYAPRFDVQDRTKCMHCANLLEYCSISKNVYIRKEVRHFPLLCLKEVNTILPSIGD